MGLWPSPAAFGVADLAEFAGVIDGVEGEVAEMLETVEAVGGGVVVALVVCVMGHFETFRRC